MLNIKIIASGNLKEQYLKDAVGEYSKRIGGMCKFEIVQLKEAPLPQEPSQAQIDSALESEAKKIFAEIPDKAYKIAMCVEGKQLTSKKLADEIEKISLRTSELCFIIGSSYGLAPSIKNAADMKLSISELTFPHQLMRVILLEQIYRSCRIINHEPYHK